MTTITLEAQLKTLDGLGLSLNQGVTIDDLLYSFGREAYEDEPFDLVLFILGAQVEREPWGRDFSDHVWHFDTECIVDTGDYVTIAQKLCALSGVPHRLQDLVDCVDHGANEAWIKYRVDGKERHWKIDLMDDWADMLTISYLIDDIEQDGKRFYFKDNGQARLMFYLDEDTATQLNKLTDGALTLMNS